MARGSDMSALRAAAATAVVLGLGLALAAPEDDPKKEAKKKKAAPTAAVTYPPALPGGQAVVTDTSDQFLKPAAALRPGVTVATQAPTVDFLYYPGQTYAGNPW